MSNQGMESEIFRYIEQLRGANSEDAFFALLHLDDKYLPTLINAYHQKSDIATKAHLVEIIWQHRKPDTLPFLVEALHHQHEAIWKNALDGIVTIGGTDSLNLLETEKNRLIANPLATQDRLEWLDEAIGQIKSTLD
jgi:hypothetical protein